MNITKMLGIAALATFAAAPAFAADMAIKAMPAPTPAWSWTGWYVGGNLGGKWAKTSTDTVNFGPNAAAGIPAGASLGIGSFNPDTFMGGAQIGYNLQSGPAVFGLEADIDAQRWSSTQTLTAFAIGTLFVPGDSFTVKSDWQGSVRGRLGYAWDRTLLYVTGGLALTGVKTSSNFVVFGIDPATAGSQTKTLAGATLGGGLEQMVTRNVSLGVEGRYSWYGSQTFNTGTVALAGPPPVFSSVSQTFKLNTAEVLGKINYHF
jgi:outer membrane immunogenic protein